jgi:uncharacterized protein YyaL (SSP411 family)
VNRLGQSTSPYLLQHAENPVDWWEWTQESFEEARIRDVPIFLSIGYSACHWCHVMAHESFENPEVAKFLNEHFVNIKVDREERPDIDSIYMEATVAMTGHGGWPMSVFLDHDGRPFYTGTYFPPTPHHGMPSFGQLIESISDTWVQRKPDILQAGERIIAALESRSEGFELTDLSTLNNKQGIEYLRGAVNGLQQSFDGESAGFGRAPKFPPSMVLEFLLRMTLDTQVGEQAERMAFTTLEAMARGGIYDQIGGGFARYSVDEAWVVPHFEKMLYDNALLIRVYAHWWRLTGNPLAERVVRESIGFLLREMRTPQGAFASALDADSEGVEGKFYAWTPGEIAEAVGAETADAACEMFEVTQSGTFEHGNSTLQLLTDPQDQDLWSKLRTQLFAARSKRIRPGQDDKVVASWNGLTISALAEAGSIFGEPEWIEAAEAAADCVIGVHFGAGERARSMSRTSRDGVPGKNSGVLDDYANMSEGLLTLHEVTGEPEWLLLARTLLDTALEVFDDGEGGFFDTSINAEKLIRRPREFSDNAEPSGWLAMANLLVRFSALAPVDYLPLRTRAELALGVVPAFALSAPRSVGWGLVALWSLVEGPWEVEVSGPASAQFAHIAALSPRCPEVRWSDGSADQAQVCRFTICEFPTSSPRKLAEFLNVGSHLHHLISVEE